MIKIGKELLGIILIIIGLAMVFLPFLPGSVLILIGLTLLLGKKHYWGKITAFLKDAFR